MDIKQMQKTIRTAFFAGGSLLIAPGSCHSLPVDIGIDAVGLPKNRNEQLKLKSEIENSITNPHEEDIIWSGNSDDKIGLQDAIEISIRRRHPTNSSK